MTTYTKATNFAVKDALVTGNPLKTLKGTELDDEFNALAVASATKANLASPTFTGVPAAPTASTGTNTTQVATTAFVTTATSTKADIASPTFTGVPAAPTASVATNTTQVATTAFVTAAVAEVSLTPYAVKANNLSDLASATTARTNLGLAIGTNVQAYDADTTKNDVANTFTATQTVPAIKITTGAGASKVLTSDAAGAATWETPAAPTAGSDNLGYLNIPQNSQSTAYTLVLADAGKHLLHPSSDANARTFTIPANASVAYPLGTAISFINHTAQVVSIAITSDVMELSATGTTGTRSLAQWGSATAVKIGATNWLISGSGLS